MFEIMIQIYTLRLIIYVLDIIIVMQKTKKKLPKKLINFLIKAQRNELTEEMIYIKLSRLTKDKNNKKILQEIAKEEKNHHDIWKSYTNISVKPNKSRVLLFVVVSRIF
ncbi:MAG: hypothetical protein B6229_01020 [Spirochaetaceae bacterium 4572_7]|nr:MAG: hypothetical protein B6229_01020 [Spirochaetaceae bacterium 4572_7]